MSSVLTVSQLNRYVAYKLKGDLKLKGIAVKGEISNFTIHFKSGHAYFTIKDRDSSLKAVMFSSCADKLKFVPENGMSVLAIGNIEVYERDGVYQIIVSELTPLGVGLMYKQMELVKEKLRKSGIFDESRKKSLPPVPKKIAVVTSLTGAALQDIIQITQRRYPLCEINIFPTQVQGEAAANSICLGLKAADKSGADTLILARGGGSPEDLMPFNTEQVAVAVAECVTPIISAVGHETDTTLSDYAADMRAATPSAAAEIATPDKQDMINAINHLRLKLDTAVKSYLDTQESKSNAIFARLKAVSPENKLEMNEKRLAAMEYKLSILMCKKLEILSLNLDTAVNTLNVLSPFNVLGRGYSLTQRDSRLIYSANALSKGDFITVKFSDGEAYAEVKEVKIDPKGD